MKVLIVDDRQEDRALLRYTLEHHHWEVTEAADGVEALAELGRARPDLVISDALMPVMDGFTLLRAMRKEPGLATIPFIFFTATYTEQHEHDLALSLGALGFLTKPLPPAAIWQQLATILEDNSRESVSPPPAEPEQFLEKYSAMIATKLEAKVRDLEGAKEQWEKTFHALHDILTIQDREMRITQANKAAGDCFQTPPAELVGRYCYEVFRGSSEPCPNCPVLQTIEDLQSHSQVICHQRLGKTFTVTSAPILDRDNRLESLVHVAHDITEQKSLEAELFQAHKMEAIGTMAGGIAHDFNNILTAILGYAELAQQQIEAGQLPGDYVAQVITAGRRAKDLVRQILTFSRKGKQEVGPLAPYPLVKEALKLLRAGLPSTIEIREEIDPASGAVMADPGKIHQVVVNLCTNAFHAMEEQKGTLTVSLHRTELTAADLAGHSPLAPGPYLELMVKDSGSGIDPDTLPHIFEPYFTTKESDKGTGLGLAVVYGIVHSLGGLIKVESVLGQGSIFRVYLPTLTTTTEEPQAQRGERAPLPSGSERVMVVDDDPMITTMLAIMLGRLGYGVSPFQSSIKALAAFTANPGSFDLVITDQTMPGLTGAKLTHELLALRPELPIIICTGYSSVLSQDQALELGIKRYLTKPLDFRELASAIREVMGEERRERLQVHG